MTEDYSPGSPQALVSGASSGIGKAVVGGLLDSGYEVTGIARRELPSRENLTSFSVDLGDLDSLPAAIDRVMQGTPRLEVAVLAAGTGRFGSLEQMSASQIREVVDLNLTANLLLCRALLPRLKQLGRGRVIFIGSEAGSRGKRQGAVYCASKFAIRGLAQALRDECAASGVAVSLIQPGMVRTPFFDQLHFEPGPNSAHALVAEDVAAAVKYIVSSPTHAVIDQIDLSPAQHVVRKKSP